MSMNEYIQYSQRQVDEIKTIGRRRAIIAVLVLGVVFIGLSYLFTNGFKEWPCSTYERLSIGHYSCRFTCCFIGLYVAKRYFECPDVRIKAKYKKSH